MNNFRSEDEIDEVLNQVSEIKDTIGSKFPGMSYEDGVEAGIRWAIGEEDANPLED